MAKNFNYIFMIVVIIILVLMLGVGIYFCCQYQKVIKNFEMSTKQNWDNHAMASYFSKASDDLDVVAAGITNVHLTTTSKLNYDTAYAHTFLTNNPHNVTAKQLGLGSVENTALSTWTGSRNITTLGTIGTGTWNGSSIANDKIASALTGKTYNGLAITTTSGTLTVADGKTLTVSDNASVSGTNTGDQSLSGFVPYAGATADLDLGDNNFVSTGNEVYLMTAFSSLRSGLFILASNTGKDWSFVNSYLYPYTAPVGTYLRDPSITTYNNQYYVCHTNNMANTDFSVISSSDLLTWSTPITVDLGLGILWAPEWFTDTDGLHIFVSNRGDQKLYETHPTNAAMTTWSDPVAITGTGLPDMIDPFVVKIGSTYYLWYKNETTNYIEYATSSSLTSGYSVIGSGDWAGWGSALEGESLVKVNDTTWRIYLDKYVQEGIYYSESTDNFATWSAKTLTTTQGYIFEHPTIIKTDTLKTIKDVTLDSSESFLKNGFFDISDRLTAHNITVENLLATGITTQSFNTGIFFSKTPIGGQGSSFIGTTTGNNDLYFDQRNLADIRFRQYASSAWNERLFIKGTDGSGNIGIGSTGPDRKLEINVGAATGGLRLTYNDPDGSAAIYSDFLLDSGGDLTITPTGGDIITAATIKAGGYQSSDGSAGSTKTITVKGSDGNNCNLTYKNGLLTADTCP